MPDPRVEKLAKLVVDYSTEVKAGDEVLIQSNILAKPFLRELCEEIVTRGAYPLIMLEEEELRETFLKYADEKVLEHVSPIEKFIMEKINVRIGILASSHTKYLNTIDPERIRRFNAARFELTDIFLRRSAIKELRWVVVAYPTKALAQEAGMSFLDYEDFVFKACGVYRDNPKEYWVKRSKEQEKIANFLGKVSEIKVEGPDTKLYLRVDGRTWINDDGHENMPGGEVFTGPIEDSIEGEIRFSYPAIWRGREVEDVKLKFRKGQVIEAKAVKGDEFLKEVLKTDDGAKRVGEFAFGLNYDIDRFTKNILFDEKIGGTIHLALGASYPETGGTNKSAIHWDMILDMKTGKVYADGDLVYSNGKFILEVL